MNLDKVKDRIRKLLAIAADDAIADGEVAAAMKLATAAMEAYQLERADIEAVAEPTEAAPISMDRVTSDCRFARLSIWESTLSHAVRKLVGSVGVYVGRAERKAGTFRVPSTRSALVWYGSAEDAKLAAELFEEWAHVIATLACGSYGGCFRGPGALYADGFTRALNEQADRAAADRATVVTASTTAIVKLGGGSLADVLREKTLTAKTWLRDECGINLGSSKRRSSGYSFGSSEHVGAFQAGRNAGQRAEFGVRRVAKLA
jgi:hypothetical protein